MLLDRYEETILVTFRGLEKKSYKINNKKMGIKKYEYEDINYSDNFLITKGMGLALKIKKTIVKTLLKDIFYFEDTEYDFINQCLTIENNKITISLIENHETSGDRYCCSYDFELYINGVRVENEDLKLIFYTP